MTTLTVRDVWDSLGRPTLPYRMHWPNYQEWMEETQGPPPPGRCGAVIGPQLWGPFRRDRGCWCWNPEPCSRHHPSFQQQRDRNRAKARVKARVNKIRRQDQAVAFQPSPLVGCVPIVSLLHLKRQPAIGALLDILAADG